MIREVLQYLGWDRGVEIHHIADLPARAGIGSSSSFTVGLLQALKGLKAKAMAMNLDEGSEAYKASVELLEKFAAAQPTVQLVVDEKHLTYRSVNANGSSQVTSEGDYEARSLGNGRYQLNVKSKAGTVTKQILTVRGSRLEVATDGGAISLRRQ